MCGIAGIIAFTEKGKDQFSRMDAALSALSKRGPDAHGKLMHENVCLGHTRLSIIDLSDAGSQPMQDVSGKYTISFNGEFYNYREKKKLLSDKGYRFRSETDTEVLLNLFAEYGTDMFEHINGFFAFAALDRTTGEVLIARDRMGIKPLYYYQDEDALVFASEMKALMQLGIPRELDSFSMHVYFQTGYIPAPYTIFKAVKKLQPGTYIRYTERKISIQNYYTIPLALTGDYSRDDYDTARQKVRELVSDAVRLRMVADVPVGAFLSGGIDSSVIVAAATEHTDRLHTFSIGYKDNPYFDETEYALEVAKKFKTEHTVFSLTNDDLFENLYNVLDYTDEPFADSSAVAVNILSMYTRQKVTVALSGDGGDELFAGYNKHHAEWLVRKGGVKSAMVKNLDFLWGAFPQSRSSALANRFRQLKRFSEGARMSPAERYWRWASVVGREEAGRLLLPEVQPDEWNAGRERFLSHFLPGGDINEVLYADMRLVLPGDMLYKVDMMSMENSLEVRVPLLDHRIVNYVFSLPPEYKIDGLRKKKLLTDAFAGVLPEKILNRPKKGFEVPMLQWLKTGLQPLVEEFTSIEWVREQGIFQPSEVERMKKALFSNNPGEVHFRLWTYIVFQYWYKKSLKPAI